MTFDKNILNEEKYNFLRENKNLKNVYLMVAGGSHAYGLNTEQSDIDIRGIVGGTEETLLGLENFESFVDEKTDTTIYNFNKIIQLFIRCNPNTIEMLGCLPEHYIFLSDEGRMLKDNANLFLSKKAFYSFTGYAISQLRRLESAIAKDSLSEEKNKVYLEELLNNNVYHLNNMYPDFGGNKNLSFKIEDEPTVSISMENYPLEKLTGIISEVNTIIKNHGKLRHRNNKKDEYHLNKHASHIIRLYYTGLDILRGNGIITYRENEHDLLMDIRNGKFANEDGTYKDSFFDLVNELSKEFEYVKNNSPLPERPNIKQINKLVIEINRKVLTK